jgi:hypothetical protein
VSISLPGGRAAATGRLRWALGVGLAMLALHGVMLAGLARHRGVPLMRILGAWDASLHAVIAASGRSGALWAFYPLWAGLLACVHALLPGVTMVLVGAAFASALFLAALGVLAVAGPSRVAPAEGRGFVLGVVLLAFTPASWTFHTAHTEPLFLLLSLLALFAAAGGRWLAAGLLTALACLTRNQGVLVAVAASALVAEQTRSPRRAALTAMLPGLALVGFLAFQWLRTGDPLAFLHAQVNWAHARSALEVLRTFWFGNPWQNTNTGSTARHVFFLGAVAASIAVTRRDRILGLYCLASLALLPLQGELVNAFRFSAVLFPLHLWAGERLAAAPVPVWLVSLMAWISLNVWVTRALAYGKWAY